MGVFTNWTYSNWHELNLDWISGAMNDLIKEWVEYNQNWDKWQTETNIKFDTLEEYVTNKLGNMTFEEYIYKWLNEHPEATTTVEDGAITDKKLNNSLKNQINAPWNLVLFGDSWTDPNSATVIDNTNWVTYFERIYPDVMIHNYAKGGAGLLVSNSFYNQTTQALNDTSYDHDLVTDVMILGNINDYANGHTNPSDYPSAMNTLINRIKTIFPKAKIHYIFCSVARPLCHNAEVSGNWNDTMFVYQTLSRFAKTSDTPFNCYNISYCFTEQSFITWGDDNYLRHLSNYGHRQLCMAINHILITGETPKMYGAIYNYVGDDITINKMVFEYDEKGCDIDLIFTITGDVTQSSSYYMELPNSAFAVQNYPRYLGNFDDIFPTRGSISQDNGSVIGIPIKENLFPCNYSRESSSLTSSNLNYPAFAHIGYGLGPGHGLIFRFINASSGNLQPKVKYTCKMRYNYLTGAQDDRYLILGMN